MAYTIPPTGGTSVIVDDRTTPHEPVRAADHVALVLVEEACS